jgi:2-polyprenyl-6-methoxyphenol hydroxylase-like FAD-dependent oxidoreductase
MNIAILGGGVAGISSAIALKLKGFDVTIYERHESETNIGAGIVVWPNAAYILEQLGVLDEIKRNSGYPSSMQRLSNTGEKLGSIDIEQINNIMGYPSLSILRYDFQRILLSKLNELGVAIKYGYEITEINEFKSGDVNIHFKNGQKTSSDIIIGADGRMSSIARKYVIGTNKPIYQGFINWIGVFESEEKIFDEIVVKDYWGIGERFGIVPVSQYKAYWAGGISATNVGARVPAMYKQELTKVFSSWSSLINTIINKTPTSRINKIYVHDHDPIKNWYKNNLIVIGDAAHAPLPTSGQGACQALEDAWHLANCLFENDTNISEAFSKFTNLRMEKTTGIIAAGRSLASSLFNPDSEFCKVRNENSKNTDYSKVAKGMAQGWSQGLPINA